MVNLTIPNITVSETTPTIPTTRATIPEAERKEEETATQEKSRLTHHKHGGEKRRHSDGQAPGAYKRRSPTGRVTQVNMEQEEYLNIGEKNTYRVRAGSMRVFR